MDFYGLFRCNGVKNLKVYANERTTKYLFSYNYIPNNFDGILIGTSISETLNTKKIDVAHVYNASISGGNISEQKLIADNVFKRGHIKLAIFCISPYLTATHGRKSSAMDPREYWGSLGSVGLSRVYVNYIRTHFGLSKDRWDVNGVSLEFTPEEVPQIVALKKTANNSTPQKNKVASVDELAFNEYEELLKTARAHGAKIIGFIPPYYSQGYAANKMEYDDYFARMSALFHHDEKIINFNTPAYSGYTDDLKNFYDGSHLSNEAANFFSTELAAAVN